MMDVCPPQDRVQWLLWGVLSFGLMAAVGCSSARLPYDSNQTRDFVAIDTSQSVGTPVVPVYSRTLLRSEWPQHFLPLEAPDPDKAGTTRSHRIIRMERPVLEWGNVSADIYGFTACELRDDQPCTPERVLLFFSVQSQAGGAGLPFRRAFDRQLRIVLDEETMLFEGQPSYETHGLTGTILEEMWVALPYEDFQTMIASDDVYLRFRRETMRLSGRKLKPFRALVAAAEGRDQLEENE